MQNSSINLSETKSLSKGVFVIAEAGVNHNGRLDLAIDMIEAAANAGADAIKFQTFKTENLVSKSAPKAEYQKCQTDENETQFNMIKKLELDLQAHERLISRCEEKKIQFLSSPFDLDSIDLLNRLKLKAFKIPSGEITNLPYLRKIGTLKKKVILSSGMSDLSEIENALNILVSAGTPLKNITVLHCNTDYPTKMADVNLRAMKTIADSLKVKVGYSDHTLGSEVSIAAVALGASIIEKHFTLDKRLPGPDHVASVDPDELKKMVNAIRNIEKAFGNGLKKPSQSEIQNREIVRKSIVAARAISQGETLTDENLAVKRPGNGVSPMQWDDIIGTLAKKDYKPDDLI